MEGSLFVMKEGKKQMEEEKRTEQTESVEAAEPATVKVSKASSKNSPEKSRRPRPIYWGVSPLVCVLLCVLCVCIGVLTAWLYYEEKYADFQDIRDAMDIVEDEYYFFDEETKEKMIVGAMKGIAANIDDKYAEYYTNEEYAELLQSDSGNYIGVGISVVETAVGEFYVKTVFPNTPASEAGLLSEDRLLSINGHSGEGLELDAFLDFFSHEEGDVNTLEVERQGETLSFTMTMREVYQPFVEYKMLEGNIGYICITEFHGSADEEVEKAMAALREQGMEKLVLDLRDNPGGSLTVVCGVAEQFLPKDSLITTIRSRSGWESTYYTHKEGSDIPMTVLINGSSASASELLSGALKDYDRAVLFGTTTFGKGIVQTFYGVKGDIGGVMKLTTDAYFTPNDVCIHGEGIAPDYEVELPEDVLYYNVYSIPYEQDTQLQAAVEYLKGH